MKKAYIFILAILLALPCLHANDSDLVWLRIIPEETYGADFMPDGNIIAATGNTLTKFDLNTGDVIKRFEDTTYSPIWQLDASKLNYRVITYDYKADYVYIWDLIEERIIKTLPFFDEISRGVFSVAISPDGSLALIGLLRNNDNNLILYDIDQDKEIKRYHIRIAPIAVTFSPDSKYFAVGTTERDPYTQLPTGSLLLFSTESWSLIKALEYREGEIWNISFSPDSKLLTCARDGNTLTVWDVESRTLVKEYGKSNVGYYPQYMSFNLDSKFFILTDYHINPMYSAIFQYNNDSIITKYSFLGSNAEFSRDNLHLLIRTSQDIYILKPTFLISTVKEIPFFQNINVSYHINQLMIRMNLLSSSFLKIDPTDLNGKYLGNLYEDFSPTGDLSVEKNIILPSGIYFLNIHSGSSVSSHKFIINN